MIQIIITTIKTKNKMNINDIITLKYNELAALCKRNVIIRLENKSGVRDIEQIDILHTIILRFLKKYRHKDNLNVDEVYNSLKMTFLGEINNYLKLKKPESLTFISMDEIKFENNNEEII